MSTMSGLVLATSDNRSFYYCTVEDGKFTDGHMDLKIALRCKEEWDPALIWKFTNIAASSLIEWSD